MYMNIILKLFIGAAGLFIIIRLIGKKALSELTPFDLIYVLVLGGMLEGSLFHPEISIWHLLFALLLWAGIIYLIELSIKKTFYASKLLQGEPAVLIQAGKIDRRELEKNNIDLEQLRAMLRQHGCFTLRDVGYAILEIDGKLSVIRKDQEEVPSVLLVDEGRVDQETLKNIGQDEAWLLTNLRQLGYDEVEELYYCEWIPGEGLHAETYQEEPSSEARLDG